MQHDTDLNDMANRVFRVNSKDYKSMMLAPDGMSLMSKGVADAAEFRQAGEKGGLLNLRKKIEPEKFKSFTAQSGEKKLNIRYKKLLEMGVPGALEFGNETDLSDVLGYIREKWGFQRTERQFSPLKASLPYFATLIATLITTGYVIYVNTVGGTYRVNLAALMAIKLGEKIGIIPTLLLGLLISGFVIRALLKAFKNPPVEVRLEP